MPESKHRRRRGGAPSRAARAAAAYRPRRKGPSKRLFIASTLTAILVIAGFAIGGIAGRGGGRGARTGSADGYVEGVGVRQQLSRNSVHVSDGSLVSYNTVPPTSGDHWNIPRACGFYEDGLPNERIVHNLEHGNIVVSYNLADNDEVDRLRDAVGDVGLANVWGLTRFYEELPLGQVAMAAWGVMDVMNGVDPVRIENFFNTYSGRLGPERIPCTG